MCYSILCSPFSSVTSKRPLSSFLVSSRWREYRGIAGGVGGAEGGCDLNTYCINVWNYQSLKQNKIFLLYCLIRSSSWTYFKQTSEAGQFRQCLILTVPPMSLLRWYPCRSGWPLPVFGYYSFPGNLPAYCDLAVHPEAWPHRLLSKYHSPVSPLSTERALCGFTQSTDPPISWVSIQCWWCPHCFCTANTP